MASIIEEQIKKIDTRLNTLECGQSLKQQLNDIKRSNKIADTKWNMGFAITAMVIAYNWLTDEVVKNNASAIIIGVLGILLLLWVFYEPAIAWLWRRIRSKDKK